MNIILHADDFGSSDDTVSATIASFERGALTSASIMVNMPATERAVCYALKNPQFSFGAHLNFTSDGSERPLCNPRDIPALVRSDGQFLPSNIVHFLALRGRLPQDQILIEMRRQIASLRDSGLPLSHLDSHGHLHKFAPFVAALKICCAEFKLPRVRTVQNLYLRAPLKSPTYWLGGWWRRGITANFNSTDWFYMPASGGDRDWTQPLLRKLADLNGSTLEIGVHPGTLKPWCRAEATEAFIAARAFSSAGHRLISWNEIERESASARSG